MTARRLAAVPDSPRRAGLYVRVSAVMGRAGEDFLSPSIQADTMRTAAARHGMTVVQVWEDIDVSGRSMTRPALAEAMTAAREGRIDVLWVYDLSRWARNAGDGLAELAQLEKLGVEVLSATETVDRSTPSGKMTAGMLLILAEHYSDMIGERWRGTIAENARRGVLHGRAPLGYVRTARRTIEPDPVLAPAVTDAFRRASAGEPLLSIARDLSRQAGRTVWPRTLRSCLRSPVYLGLVPHLGQTLPGRHPAIVDQQTWEAVQARLDSGSRLPPRTKDARWSLAGLVRCGGCDRVLYRRGDRDRMFCASRQRDGMSDCVGVGAPACDEVEAAVLEQLRLRLVEVEDTSAAEAVRMSQAARTRGDLRAVLDELGRIDRSVSVLAVKLAEGVLSDAAYASAVKILEERRALLTEQRMTLQTSVTEERTFAASRDLAAALLELWPGMDVQARNAALRTHVDRVILRRATFRSEPLAARVDVRFHGGG